MISKFFSFMFPEKNRPAASPLDSAPVMTPSLRAGLSEEILVLPLAGTTFQGRDQWIRGLSLCSCLSLCPEPENSFDEQAVAVRNPAGNTVGYLPRMYAHPLFEALRTGRVRPDAEVIRLEQNPQATTPSVHIAVVIPEGLIQLRPSRLLEFSCSEGSGGALYVMLNCDGALLEELESGLNVAGLSVERKGPAHRLGGDGHVYEWFLRMVESVTESMVHAWFLEHHQLQPYGTVNSEDVDAYAAQFDAELATKEEQIDRLKTALEASLEETRLLRRQQQKEIEAAQWRTVERMLPDLVFVRDSRDILTHELAKPEFVYRHLLTLQAAPENVSSKRVQSADNWLEFHFGTGEANDGRCYYKRAGGGFEVLISFKQQQKKDIRWMQKNNA